MITENLSTLKIHNLTKEQYERELAAGRIDENALYLTPSEDIGWNDLKDKPFGDFTDGSDTWYRNGEDISNNPALTYNYLHKVSDSVLTMDDLVNGFSVVFNEFGNLYTYTCTPDMVSSIVLPTDRGIAFTMHCSDGSIRHFASYITEIDGNEPGIYVFYSDEDYCVESFTINGFTGFPYTKKINKKYLPETTWEDIPDKPFGDNCLDTLTWDGVITTTETIQYGAGKMVKVSDIISLDDILGCSCEVSYMLSSGEIIRCKSLGYSPMGDKIVIAVLTDGNKKALPIIEIHGENSIHSAGIYFLTGLFPDTNEVDCEGYVCSLKIDNYKFIKPIDTKYLTGLSIQHNHYVGTTPVVTEGDGAAYTATIPGVTRLYEGLRFVLIPHVNNTTTEPTLNVNDLGAFPIYARGNGHRWTPLALNTNDGIVIAANKSVDIAFTGNHWLLNEYVIHGEHLQGRVLVENGGVPETNNAAEGDIIRNINGVPRWMGVNEVPDVTDAPDGAVLCNIDGTPAWKELEESKEPVISNRQGLIELYDPKDSLLTIDTNNRDYYLSCKDYKVFDGKLSIEDYANGGSIIYEDSTGLKIVEFISHDASSTVNPSVGMRMTLLYDSSNPEYGFDVCATDFSTGDTPSGAHYYPKDDENRSAGLYFTWVTGKNNNFAINVKGLYLNGCKKFIKLIENYNIEYTDSFTFNGNIKNKAEMMTSPQSTTSKGYYYRISDAIFTVEDFANGCACRFVDSTGIHSNTQWGMDYTCAIHENQKYADILYTDDNGNTINIGYYCFEGSPYPPGFYMYNTDDFKILGFSVPGAKKFIKEAKTNEELAHKGKTYSNSISWDYDMENRETDGYGFYKISDEHFTLEDLKDGYFVEYSPSSVSEDNYGYTYYIDESQCWAEIQQGCTHICTTDENGNTYASIISVPEGFLQSPGTYFYCDDWYFNAPYSLTIRGFKEFIVDISSEEAVSPIAKKEKTNILTWDGIITEPSNLHIIGWKEDESNHSWNYAFFYNVSNAIITLEDLKDGVLTRIYSYEDSGWAHIPFDEDHIVTFKDGSIKIKCYDNYGNHCDGWDIYCYPENSTYPAGVYFGCSRDIFYSAYKLDDYVSGLEIPNVYKFNAVNKIDAKYLSDYNDIPNIPVGILPAGGDTLIWDGNTEGLESIKDNTFFKVSNAFDIDDLFNAEFNTESIIIEYNPSPSGETIIEEAAYRPANDSNRLFEIFGYDEDGNEHILAYIDYEGIYFASAANGYMYIHSLTVPGFKKFPLLKKLDKKYLPDGIGGLPTVTAEDNGKFLQVVDGVWAAVSLPIYNGEVEDV